MTAVNLIQNMLNSNAPSAALLRRARGDLGVLRPWLHSDGNSYVSMSTGRRTADGRPEQRHLRTNASALLTREDWLRIDTQVMFAAKQRLRLWGDIYSAAPYTIPNGMGTIAIQHTIANGDANAIISMDPVRQGERSRPTLDIGLIPLPVIHSDGSFTAREIAVSDNGGMPLDTTNIELSARKVAEIVEQLSIGSFGSYTYNGGTIYGLTNFPQRITKSMTNPAAGGYTPQTTITEVLAMIKALEDAFAYGPYILYHSNAWGPTFDADYQQYYGDYTLRTRLSRIAKIKDVRNLDFLTGYQIVLVQLEPQYVQGIQGMPFTTVQWQEQGGMEECFKVMCMLIPRIRADFNGNTGINHGTA